MKNIDLNKKFPEKKSLEDIDLGEEKNKRTEWHYRYGFNEAVDAFMEVINSELGHVKKIHLEVGGDASLHPSVSQEKCEHKFYLDEGLNIVCGKCGHYTKPSPSISKEQEIDDLARALWCFVEDERSWKEVDEPYKFKFKAQAEYLINAGYRKVGG